MDYTQKTTAKGFTLIELLISITILMIFLGVASRSFTTIVSANKSARNTQQIYSDAQNIFNILGDAIKNGFIDYSFCSESACGYNLSILEKDGQTRRLFKFDPAKKQVLFARQILSGESERMSWANDDSGWQSLTSDENSVDDFKYDIFPSTNPYSAEMAADDNAQYQPSVTLFLSIKGYSFKTTYSSRAYGKEAFYK